MTNIALLIDADNISAKHIDDAITVLQKRGTIVERYIFGDWGSAHLSSWNSAILKHALKQYQQNAYVKNKNATDIALVICAMELLYTRNNIDEYAIMSSDSDFTPLVQKLRQVNKSVFGLVGKNVSKALLQALNAHYKLDNATAKPAAAKPTAIQASSTIKPAKTLSANQRLQIVETVKAAIQEAIDTKTDHLKALSLSKVAVLLKTQLGIEAKEYGYKNFRTLLSTFDEISCFCEKNNSAIYYFMKNSRPASLASRTTIVEVLSHLFEHKEKQGSNQDSNPMLDISLINAKFQDRGIDFRHYGYSNFRKFLESFPQMHQAEKANHYYFNPLAVDYDKPADSQATEPAPDLSAKPPTLMGQSKAQMRENPALVQLLSTIVQRSRKQFGAPQVAYIATSLNASTDVRQYGYTDATELVREFYKKDWWHLKSPPTASIVTFANPNVQMMLFFMTKRGKKPMS